MRVSPSQFSFSAGEISPALGGRPDYQRYQTGAEICRGFVPLTQGVACRGPGTIYLGSTKNDAIGRLVDFVFARNDALTIELTDQLARFWRYGALVDGGGSPYELVTPFLEADLEGIQYAGQTDAVFMADGARPIQQMSRLALDNWTIADAAIKRGPFQAENLDQSITVQASAESGTGITLTASSSIFEAGHVGGVFRLRTTNNDVPLWTGNTAVTAGDRMQADGRIYEVVSGTNTGVNEPVHREGDQLSQASGGVTWRYIGTDVGVVKITAQAGTTATADVVVQIPSGCVSSATWAWSEGAWSNKNGWPRALVIHDERLYAGFTDAAPSRIWASTFGDYLDFFETQEVDSSFAYDLTSNRGRVLGQWLASGSQGLFVGGLEQELVAYSTDQNASLARDNFKADLETSEGSGPQQPISPNGKPVFISEDGERIFELRYSIEARKHVARELSQASDHLGKPGFAEMVWKRSPRREIWIRRRSGDLVVMNHKPAEDVLGLAPQGVADGFVESLAVTPSATGSESELHMIVRRTVDGQTRRYVERQAALFGPIEGELPSRAVHLFSSKIYDLGAATDTFTGLDHLEGEEVSIWSDAGELGPKTVSGGQVTTDVEAADYAVIGKLDTGQLFRTMDVVTMANDGTTRSEVKRGVGLVVHYMNTLGCEARAVTKSFGKPDHFTKWQNADRLKNFVDASAAFSGLQNLPQPGSWGEQIHYEFRPIGGMPVCIAGITTTADVKGS